MKQKVNKEVSVPAAKSITLPLSQKILLTISFFEGASVMVVELLGAKIIAPFYGTSLYVWASVLGVTLGALASGYYFGGWISQKNNNEKTLFLVIGTGGVFTLLAPLIAPAIMQATLGFGVRAGSFFSVLFYLFIPVACMGMVSPLITQLINGKQDKAGRSAGLVYAVSTVGGILATFAAGFYFIPYWGIKVTAFMTGGMLCVIAITGFSYRRNLVGTSVFSLLLLLFILPLFKNSVEGKNVKILYESSGILGEWKVADRVVAVYQGQEQKTRTLLLNGIDQTYTQVGDEPVSLWNYPHKIAALAGINPSGSRALLLGMGGGSIAYNLVQLGFDVDIVELDGRIPFIARTYFGYNPDKSRLYIDDARHYIRRTTNKYDVVIFDIINGEVQPAHVFTLEGLNELKRLLNQDALVIINFQGRFDMEKPELSRAPRSVYKTMMASGFQVHFTERLAEGQKSLTGDLIIYGTNGNDDIFGALKSDLRYNAIFPYENFTEKDFIPSVDTDFQDALVMTDDKPCLELLNAYTILEWRQNKINDISYDLSNNGFPLFR